MVECTALEMRHRCKPIGGSNPSLSAIVPLSCVLETQQHRPAASAFRSVISWLRTELLCQRDQSGMTYLRLVVPLYRIL